MVPVIVMFPCLLIARCMERYKYWVCRLKDKFTYIRIK